MLASQFAEERAEALRAGVRCSGFGSPQDAPLLLNFLGDCVQVQYRQVPRGLCLPGPDGRGWIVLPPNGGDLCAHYRHLLEEIAHYLLSSPTVYASWLREECALRLERVQRWREEHLARRFVLAWLLPAELAERYACDEELAQESGCTLAEVRERRRHLRGSIRVVGDEAPKWSAARHYRVGMREEPRAELVLAHGSEELFRFPSRPGCLRRDAAALYRDLAALTPGEFALKHRYARVETPRYCPSLARRVAVRSAW